MKLKVAPSILSADFSCLGDQVRAVDKAGIDQIHIDVMDGHFVPNLSMGPLVLRALRRVTDLPLDVHLMITDPEKYLEPFVEAGARHVSFHVEARGDHRAMFDWLHDRGVGAGIALNPETPVDAVLEYLPHVELLLVMTVHPGFGGQSFLAENLEKVRRVRREEAALRPGAGTPLDIQVDGGVGAANIAGCREAGANVFVAGSSIFGHDDPAAAVAVLRRAVGLE